MNFYFGKKHETNLKDESTLYFPSSWSVLSELGTTCCKYGYLFSNSYDSLKNDSISKS
jgi:hypothetical protein